MVFQALTVDRSRGRCWKPRPEAAVFNTSLGTWRMLIHCKTMFDRYYCIKTENICYISRYFLHYFVSPSHRCLANAIYTDYARSRIGQYTSHNGSKSVAPLRSYWKLFSRALKHSTWFALLIYGFLPVNARFLITCDTAVYAIIWCSLCFLVLCYHWLYSVFLKIRYEGRVTDEALYAETSKSGPENLTCQPFSIPCGYVLCSQRSFLWESFYKSIKGG